MILRLWFFLWHGPAPTPPPKCDICHKKMVFFFEGFPYCKVVHSFQGFSKVAQGCPWLSKITQNHPRLSKITQGHQRFKELACSSMSLSMHLHELAVWWACLQFDEPACTYISFYAPTYACMQFHEFAFSSIKFHISLSEQLTRTSQACRACYCKTI